MAAKKVDINIKTTADTTGLKQTTVAANSLTTATKANSTAINTTSANTGKMGQVAQGAGYQIQDFAVQVGSGTNALVAFSQQAPQFLGMFGPAGAIAGAVVAIGAIAAKVFMGMGEDATSASDKADTLAEAIKKIGEEAGKIKSEEIDLGRDAIEQAIELTKLLAQGFKEATAQERQFSEQAVEGFNKIKIAEIELRKLRSGITDDQVASEKFAASQKLIVDIADQQKKQEEEKRQAAESTLEIARQEVITKGAALNARKEELDLEIQKLETLRQQKAELEKVSKQGEYYASGEADIFTPTPEALAAKQSLASTPFDAQIEALKASIEAIAKATDGGLLSDVRDAADGLAKAQVSVQTISDLVTGQIEQIDLKAQEQLITENTAQLQTQAKTNSDLLKSAFENVQPLNKTQQEGLLLIDKATEDGLLIASESVDVQRGISMVLSTASTQQKITIGNVNKLIQLMNGFSGDLLQQKKQIDAINQRYPGIIK
jgi:hypothetical protein